jgi:hypothetical protein
LDDEATNSA